MILEKFVKFKVNSAQLKHLRSVGYNVKTGDEIEFPVDKLNHGSNIKIVCQCDVCGKIKTHPYRRYLRSINNSGFYACSSNCAKGKTKNTFIKKYGVEHHFQTEETKNKIKSTWKENYGVEHFSHSDVYKHKKKSIINKRKKTIHHEYIEKYGLISIDGENIIKYCDNHNGEYTISKKLFQNRIRYNNITCTVCYPKDENNSLKEIELYNFIKQNLKEDVLRTHRINNKEIDVYVPSLNLGFEFNGLYWHNELHKENDYHLNKTESMEENGIHLIHIWEDDWNDKCEIVKSRILNLLGKSENKIYARKCVIRELDPKIYKDFLNKNHIQGVVNSKVKLGLYHNEDLVSVMGFGSLRKSLGHKSVEGNWELLRFCNKLNTNVLGGSSKLFKYFINTYKPSKVISYADRSWSIGGMYKKIGFELTKKTNPNYYYIIDKKRINRYNFRKDKLIEQGYDKSLTEKQIMISKKIYRIYDSGSLVFTYHHLY